MAKNKTRLIIERELLRANFAWCSLVLQWTWQLVERGEEG